MASSIHDAGLAIKTHRALRASTPTRSDAMAHTPLPPGTRLSNPGAVPYQSQAEHSPLHAVVLVEPVANVVYPGRHAVQLGLGLAAIPPADQLPLAQVPHSAPPKPGRQTGRAESGEVVV